MNGRSQYLPARLLQLVGIILLGASFVLWALTGKESVLMVSASMSLILLGAYGGVIETLKKVNGKSHTNGNGTNGTTGGK
jgi:hypothetical protein